MFKKCLKLFETLLFGWSLKICRRCLSVFEKQSCVTSVNNSHYHGCRSKFPMKRTPFGHFRENAIVEIIYALFFCFPVALKCSKLSLKNIDSHGCIERYRSKNQQLFFFNTIRNRLK